MTIKNMGVNKSTAMSVIESLSVDVYLGGSRRMAEKYGIVINKDTDYDFYATYDSSVEAELRKGGFIPSSQEYDLDDECCVVYCRDNVQIVLRRDAEFYEKVFESISEDVYVNCLWKSSPAKPTPNVAMIGPIFNMMFAIAHAFEPESNDADYPPVPSGPPTRTKNY